MHPDTIATGGDETTLAQIGQMARHRRLRESEAVMEVADAHFVVPEQGEDAHARLMAWT
jgi:hypothetical protein